ncbi:MULTISPECIES: amidohydrolase family protein [Paraburkholderia]|uniref:amidohydrolase family protein n=1 Tax=Paraburkholderia TaxID=1822464 RepID=UPI002AB2A07B|nr:MULTISPECIES: amidohydrolase family protein [Paraburkholderia]
MSHVELDNARWDCHTHIYGPWDAFPLPADAVYRPGAAPMSSLLDVHRELGISRGVLVQAACYQSDHSALLDAIVQTGGRYRGVALLDGSETDDQLHALHEGGVRGIRFNFMGHLAAEVDLGRLRSQAERVGELGWHVLLHGRLAQVLPVLNEWRSLETVLVVDHMGRPDGVDSNDSVQREQLWALHAHLQNERRWIKLSGVDRMMSNSAHPWPDAVPLVRDLLAAAPDRAIWGSDWPHPNIQGDVPDDAKLLAFIESVCSNPEAAHDVLVRNPLRLYG